jgi:molybdopterin synthase sulfur carrier subunit
MAIPPVGLVAFRRPADATHRHMKILYFAWLRERLNRGEEEVSPPPDVVTIRDLIAWLRANDEAADLAMQRPEIIKAAIDAKIVGHDAPIAGAKIIALFPPMTGG